jgi:hypothetical protein
MVHYIRFLKTPRIQSRSQGVSTLTTLITITTDLGDSFLAEDVDLQASIAHSDTHSLITGHQFSWKAGWRDFSLSIRISAKDAGKSMILGIGMRRLNLDYLQRGDTITVNADLPVVISGWSAPFGGPHNITADPLIERRLEHHSGSTLSIWEETGNNIAQHVW